MAEAANSQKKNTLKGGRRGGTRFPQINLQKALEYAKKLVSKTHNGPQPEQTILVGVFNTAGTTGEVRASALKQYGLMEGDTSEGYVASQLARNIEAAVPEERSGLLQQAFLKSKLFKQIYDTLQPDTVSRARIRQVAITAKVHPDNTDKCVACFVESAIHAGIGAFDGENIALTRVGDFVAEASGEIDREVEEPEEKVEETEQEQEADKVKAQAADEVGGQQSGKRRDLPHSDVRVNLAVDSSSDPDKLEKQLKLLKQYGLLR